MDPAELKWKYDIFVISTELTNKPFAVTQGAAHHVLHALIDKPGKLLAQFTALRSGKVFHGEHGRIGNVVVLKLAQLGRQAAAITTCHHERTKVAQLLSADKHGLHGFGLSQQCSIDIDHIVQGIGIKALEKVVSKIRHRIGSEVPVLKHSPRY